MPSVSQDVTISNKLGLHARPAMAFVDLAGTFSSEIRVARLGDSPCEVDGKSVMQMITLEALPGTRLRIVAEGPDAAGAVNELVSLIDGGFGED